MENGGHVFHRFSTSVTVWWRRFRLPLSSLLCSLHYLTWMRHTVLKQDTDTTKKTSILENDSHKHMIWQLSIRPPVKNWGSINRHLPRIPPTPSRQNLIHSPGMFGTCPGGPYWPWGGPGGVNIGLGTAFIRGCGAAIFTIEWSTSKLGEVFTFE